MKKVMAICLAMGLLLAINGVAQADQIWDYPLDYVASTNLILGNLGTDNSGTPGYIIASPFQLNMLYQPGILNSDIDAINNYLGGTPPAWPEGSYNYSDNTEYVFRFDQAGNLPLWAFDAGTYESGQYPDGAIQQGPTGPEIKWTLTGWGQTILAGDIVDQGNNTYFFQVLPAGTYRPFPNDPPVNDVEVFSGQLACEVLGYTFHGSLDNLAGGILEVKPVPLPGTLLLLGSGLAGLVLWRKRRQASLKD